MKKSLAVMLVVAATVWTVPARAEQDTGWTLGARLAYGVPLGSLASGGIDFNKVYTGAVPLWLDAGYRFSSNFSAGVYFQYAFASIANDYKSGLAASFVGGGLTAPSDFGGSDLRLGAQGIYKFLPDAGFAPWLGVGFGYEWANTSFKSSAGGIPFDIGVGFRGLEILLQAGGDVRVSPGFSMGPFVAFTLSWFQTVAISASGGGASASQSLDINNKSAHEWLQFGLKGTFNL